MTKTLKAITYAAGAFIGLIVLAAIALSLFLDINAYKPRLEAAASDIAGMEVSVNGRLGIGFFPGLRVRLEDVHIRNQGTELVTASKARIGVDFLALLKQDVRIRKVVLEHPNITIERGRDGRFNYERTGAVRGPLPGLNLAKLSFSDGTFRYVDWQSGKGFEAAGCSLDANRLRLAERDRPGIMKNLSIEAEIVCGAVRTKEHAASDLKMTVAAQRGVFDIKPLTMRAYEGQGSGNLRADLTGADLSLVDLEFAKLNGAKLERAQLGGARPRGPRRRPAVALPGALRGRRGAQPGGDLARGALGPGRS